MSCWPGCVAPGTRARSWIRADIGFENHELLKTLDARGIEFSIGVKHSKKVKRLIEQIPDSDWVTVADHPEGGEAQVAESRSQAGG